MPDHRPPRGDGPPYAFGGRDLEVHHLVLLQARRSPTSLLPLVRHARPRRALVLPIVAHRQRTCSGCGCVGTSSRVAVGPGEHRTTACPKVSLPSRLGYSWWRLPLRCPRCVRLWFFQWPGGKRPPEASIRLAIARTHQESPWRTAAHVARCGTVGLDLGARTTLLVPERSSVEPFLSPSKIASASKHSAARVVDALELLHLTIDAPSPAMQGRRPEAVGMPSSLLRDRLWRPTDPLAALDDAANETFGGLELRPRRTERSRSR